MPRTQPNPFTPLNAITGIAGILFGIIVGYIIGAGQLQPVPSTAPAQPAQAAVVTDAELQAYRNVLAADPRNLQANVALANKLYDAGRYAEAIPYYEQAVTIDMKDANLSTDLATALFYVGRVDDALAQLEKSLAIDPKHAQTLFNLGIVRRDGKKDAKGAVEAWERLLAVAPGYAEADRVRALIAQART